MQPEVRAPIRPARAVQHAVAVLRALAEHQGGRRVGDVARAVALDKSSVSRILQTLEFEHLAVRDEAGLYRLGLGLLQLASSALAAIDAREVARPFLGSLADQTGETVNLAVWEGGEAVVVENTPGHEPIQALGRVGQRYPAHASALGKLLLSYQPRAVIDAVLSRELVSFTSRTVTARPSLEAQLAEIRRMGFAINLGEYRKDVAGLAAPIRDHTGAVIAGIGLAGPAFRLDIREIERLSKTVISTAQAISAHLGLVPARAGAADPEAAAIVPAPRR